MNKAIMIAGILSVQSGENPRNLGDRLLAFFSSDMDIAERYIEEQILRQARCDDAAGGIENGEGLSEVNSAIENLDFEMIAELKDMYIQIISREVDTQDLAKALKGSSTRLREKVFSNMAERATLLLSEDMKYMGPISDDDIMISQKKILKIVLRLEQSGDLVLEI